MGESALIKTALPEHEPITKLKNLQLMNFTPNFETTDTAKHEFEPVTKYMATDLITFKPDDEIGHVIKVLSENQISGAPVLNDDGELIGIISEQDCLRVVMDSVYHNQPVSKHYVRDYMHKDIISVPVDADIVDVANMFLKHRFRRFPVVDAKGRLKGLVSKRDILNAALKMKTSTW